MTAPVRPFLAFALLAACAGDPTPGGPLNPTPDVPDDATGDLGADAAEDAQESGPDATPDSAPDAAPDAALDATTDASPDARADAATDAADASPDTADAALDAAPDASPDAAPSDVAAPDVAPDLPSPDAAPDRADVLDVPIDVSDVADVADVADAPPDALPDCAGPTCPLQVVAGAAFACARFADGTAACWGSDLSGQIGDGTTDPSPYRERMTSVRGLTDVVELAAGAAHACARRADGSVWCWGANHSRQVGSGRSGSTEPTPVAVVGLAGATRIACGGLHSCALLGDGTVRCWGGNAQGQLGDGSTTTRPAPVAVGGLADVRTLAAGASFTCAVLADGTARCWGEGSDGQLGGASTAARTTPSAVPGVAGAVAITAGTTHACAVRGDGGALCWGSNDHRALGDPAAPPGRVGAVAVRLTPRIRSIHAGFRHTCAVTADDATYCWGRNEQGEVGDGRSGFNVIWDSPTATRDVPPVLGLGAGRSFNCAAARGGAVVCWGLGTSGQLGNGAVQGFASPQGVPALRGVAQVEARGNRTCARLGDGSVWCWGDGAFGGAGYGQYLFGCFTPVAVGGVAGADEVAVGDWHACARRRDGAVRCWGDTTYGALGASTPGSLHTITDVVGVRATALALGRSRSCALAADGSVRCWGRNYDGDLGVGTADNLNHPTADRPVVGVTTAAALGAGRHHACALLRDRTVACWGANARGELGDGSTSPRPAPVAVVGVANAVQVVGGAEHVCARLADGSVWCWGNNGNGQCGADLATIRVPSPSRIAGITDARAVAAGDSFTCALRGDGTVWCWGSNTSRQLGEAPFSAGRGTAARVPGLAGVTAIAAGAEHACALLGDGTLRCWGAFTDGQLGLGHVYPVLR